MARSCFDRRPGKLVDEHKACSDIRSRCDQRLCGSRVVDHAGRDAEFTARAGDDRTIGIDEERAIARTIEHQYVEAQLARACARNPFEPWMRLASIEQHKTRAGLAIRGEKARIESPPRIERGVVAEPDE